MAEPAKPINNEMKIVNYCVSFIDVLGQRDALQGEGWLPHFQSDEERSNFIKRLKESVGVILSLQQQAESMIRPLIEPNPNSLFRKELSPEQQKIWDEMNKTRITTQRWSDGIVSYVSLGDSEIKCPINGLFGVFILAGSLCFLGLASRHPIRGAIDGAWAIELRKEEIYGAAVARAYELESEIASYPRIVVSQRIVDLLQDHIAAPETDLFTQNNRAMAESCLNKIIKDTDGHWILHYLGDDFRKQITQEAHVELYKRAHEYISNQLHTHYASKNTKLAFRYSHLMSYFDAHLPKATENKTA